MHGLLVLDKPAGLSSSRALDPFRAALDRSRRVGHAGTLDPFATGVLLVLVGDATRLAEIALRIPKTYEATVRFGEETETLDPESAVVRHADPGPRADTEQAGDPHEVSSRHLLCHRASSPICERGRTLCASCWNSSSARALSSIIQAP